MLTTMPSSERSSSSTCSSPTESAPPETAAATRSPGCISLCFRMYSSTRPASTACSYCANMFPASSYVSRLSSAGLLSVEVLPLEVLPAMWLQLLQCFIGCDHRDLGLPCGCNHLPDSRNRHPCNLLRNLCIRSGGKQQFIVLAPIQRPKIWRAP